MPVSKDFPVSVHLLFKSEHAVRKLFFRPLFHIRIIRVRMMTVEKFHNMEPAPIHIKVNVPLLKIRRDGLPDFNLRMQFLDLLPGGISDSAAVNRWRYEQDLQLPALSVNAQDDTACSISILHDTVCLAAVNRLLYGLPGNNLLTLFKMIVPASEFLQRTIVECSLSSLVKGHN